jgi:uncharacterized membrane protein YeaQ/YmgE (transglycosylase-associated protein family)
VTQQPEFLAMHLPCASARLLPVSLHVLDPPNGHDTLNLYPTRSFQTRSTFCVTVSDFFLVATSSIDLGLPADTKDQNMSILWTIIIGFIAGVIAKFIMPGDNEPAGFILTAILGIVGAFVATFLGQALGWYGPGEGAGLIGAVVGMARLSPMLEALIGLAFSHLGALVPARAVQRV